MDGVEGRSLAAPCPLPKIGFKSLGVGIAGAALGRDGVGPGVGLLKICVLGICCRAGDGLQTVPENVWHSVPVQSFRVLLAFPSTDGWVSLKLSNERCRWRPWFLPSLLYRAPYATYTHTETPIH